MYDLHRLGWHAFENLCSTIVRECLGQTVNTYSQSRDEGQDGYFEGTWTQAGGEALNGRFVFQCKFTSKADRNFTTSILKGELPKVKKLVEENRCNIYVLLTNYGVSSGVSQQATEILKKETGVSDVCVYGISWLCQQINESKRLRMLVPQVYGIGDMSEILDDRAYRQSQALLDGMRDELKRVVVTETYSRAANALQKHGLVLLTGGPAVGKTTIASLLGLAAVDQYDRPTVTVRDPDDLIKHWNPNSPDQLFLVDDAFGTLQHELALVDAWNKCIPTILQMVRGGAKIVMTSRDYIYKGVQDSIKTGAFPMLKEGEVVVNVQDIKPLERQRILYNHMKFGTQPKSFLSKAKPYLKMVAAHSRFVPETARRLGHPFFTQNLRLTKAGLNEFVEKQGQLLIEVLKSLDSDSRAALALVYMRRDGLANPVAVNSFEKTAVERLGSTTGGCGAALQALGGGLIYHDPSESVWRFMHPTIGDAFSSVLGEDPELLAIYIAGASAKKLIGQVSCDNAKRVHAIVIPPTLYQQMINKFDNFGQGRNHGLDYWAWRKLLYGFLAQRCSGDFLKLYIDSHSMFLKELIQDNQVYDGSWGVDLIVAICDHGLLPEDSRSDFVKLITEATVDGTYLSAIGEGWMARVFSNDEIELLRDTIRREVIPCLGEIRDAHENAWDPEEEPDWHMQPFLHDLDMLRNGVAYSDDSCLRIDEQIREVNNWIANADFDPVDSDSEEDVFLSAEKPKSKGDGVGRSIFDDIDD